MARPALDKTRLGQVVDVVSNIELGGADAQATDVLGNVYEYFLEQFALAEGRKGGEFYTPRSVVRLLVEMLQPYQRPRLRPLLRLGRHVRAVRPSSSSAHASGNGNARSGLSVLWSPKAAGDCLHLRPGVELHHLANGEA